MLTDSRYIRRCSAHLRSLHNHRWLVLLATIFPLLIARQNSTGQTVEAPGVVVTGEAIATPTPHDNFREMRQHLLPEVSSTEITVTKKATVIKLDQQPPVENNNEQELFVKAPGFLITSNTRRANSISIIVFHLQCDSGGYGSVGVSPRWWIRESRRST